MSSALPGYTICGRVPFGRTLSSRTALIRPRRRCLFVFFHLLKCIHVCVDSFNFAFAHLTRNIRIDNSSQRPCKAILLTLFQRQLDCPLGQSGRLWLTWRNWQTLRGRLARLLFLENFANEVFFSESIQGHYFAKSTTACLMLRADPFRSIPLLFFFLKMWLNVDDRMTMCLNESYSLYTVWPHRSDRFFTLILFLIRLFLEQIMSEYMICKSRPVVQNRSQTKNCFDCLSCLKRLLLNQVAQV